MKKIYHIYHTYEETYDGNAATYDHASHYAYDIHGNVDIMVQEIPALATYGSQFKKIRYEYDLVSGKVNSVHFNEGELDQFHHKYTYDADNRITQVETSRDNLNWDIDATYQYYHHGPLMRAEIGDLKVQGVDFAYTLHGWIKGVNASILDPDRDMGKDGKVSVGNMNQYVARDAFGYILGYYSDPGNSVEDYMAINSSGANHFAPATSGSDLMNFRENLYNGNITSMQTVLPNCSTYNVSRTISSETFGNAYKYDQLNRIKSSRTFTNLNTVSNAWGTAGMVSQDYSTDYNYDANGNITNLTRWGNGSQMDEFTYQYDYGSSMGTMLESNRLYHVNDATSSTNYADDIDDQGTFDATPGNVKTANNYGYDELGNLVRDNAEEISSIEWNVQGKITKVNRTTGSAKPTLEFTYDAMGQRLSKKIIESGGNVKTFYYIRDAQGNEMCRYVAYTESGNDYFVSEEHSIYGSSRLGLQTRRDTLYMNTTITPNFDYVFRDLGTKQYELSNHLGNVLATVTDQNKPVSSLGITIDSYEPVIVSISDYYPFGSIISNRSWSDAARDYRYGFNGQEKENEMNECYSFEFRIHNSKLGRFLSIDPKHGEFPWNSPYSFCENRVIDGVELEGLERVNYNLVKFDGVIVGIYVSSFHSNETTDPARTTTTNQNNTVDANGNITLGTVSDPYPGQSKKAEKSVSKLNPDDQDEINTFTSTNPSDNTGVGDYYSVPQQFNSSVILDPGAAGSDPTNPPLDFGSSIDDILSGSSTVMPNNTTKIMIVTNGSVASNANAQAIVGTPAIPATPTTPAVPATGLMARYPNVQFCIVSDGTLVNNDDQVLVIQNPTADYTANGGGAGLTANQSVVQDWNSSNGTSTPQVAKDPTKDMEKKENKPKTTDMPH